MKPATENKALALGMAVSVVILAAIGLLCFHTIQGLMTTQRWVTASYEEIGRIEAVRTHLAQAELGCLGFWLTGDERHLDPYQQAVPELESNLKRLAELTTDHARQRERLETLSDLIAEKLALLRDSIEQRRHLAPDVPSLPPQTRRESDLVEDIRFQVSLMVRAEHHLLEQRSAEARSIARRTFFTLLVGFTAAFVLLGVVFLRLGREVRERTRAEQAVRRARDELETRVEERTAELAVTNRMLQEKIAERVRAERLLKESQALFENLARVAPVGIFRADAEGRWTYLNHRLCQITGRAAEELLGDRWRGVIHPDDREEVEAAWPRPPRSLRRFEKEFRLLRPDGSEAWVLCQSVPERDEHGDLREHIGTVTDVSRRRRDEEALRESEQRFRQIATETKQVFWLTELDPERLLYVSPIFEKVWGCPPEDLYRQPDLWLRSIHEDDQQRVEAAWRAWIAERQGEYDLEYRVVRPDGAVRWVHDRGMFIRNHHGEVYRVSGFADDITERKNTEQALLESRQLLQSTMDALSAHIAILDDHGGILFVNRLWRAFAEENGLRWPAHGAAGNYLRVCDQAGDHGCADGARAAQGIRDVINGFHAEFWMEYPCHSPTEQRWFQMRVTRLPHSDPVRLAVAHENVTEIKQAEHALRQLSGRLFLVQDEERRRIARELHDVTGQNVSAVALNLSRLQTALATLDDKPQRLLKESLALIEQSLKEIRTLSYLLHPPFLDDTGLFHALNWYVEGFTKRSGVHVDLVALPEVGRLPAEVETALFRIVQESLTNIHRHSGSSTAAIQLVRDHSEVRLEVRDRGRAWIEPGENRTPLGVGITGMRERIRQLGGTLEIDFSAHGTTVSAVVPIREGLS